MMLGSMIGDFEVPVCHVEVIRDYSVSFTKVSKTEDAASVLHAMLDKSPVEQFVALYLNTSAQIIGAESVAMGDLDKVHVGIRNLFRGAIVSGAYKILVGHNHPGGDCTPSDDDIMITGSIINASTYIGIPMRDHVIVSPRGNHFSILDNEEQMLIRLMDMKLRQALVPPSSKITPKPTF
jgi:DNA repair protein RadC